MLSDPTVMTLMYFVVPLWLLAGFADWLCHRASHIATTTGAKESLIHLLMFTEVGVPLVAVLFLDVNAGIILLMIGSFLVHEATALWDVSHATTAREVTPIEQHVHSFLEMIPLMAIVAIVGMHWGQFLALFGLATNRLASGSSARRSRCRCSMLPPSSRPWCCSSSCLISRSLRAASSQIAALSCRRRHAKRGGERTAVVRLQG
ncbi:MAG: hypothetical protein ACJ8AH_04880 [Stellaceae bacterium]